MNNDIKINNSDLDMNLKLDEKENKSIISQNENNTGIIYLLNLIYFFNSEWICNKEEGRKEIIKK